MKNVRALVKLPVAPSNRPVPPVMTPVSLTVNTPGATSVACPPNVPVKQKEIVKLVEEGYTIVLLGTPKHPEVVGLLGFAPNAIVVDEGQVLAVFPEGTRSRDGALQQVREGVGMLALRSGAQVLPVAVVDSDLMWPRGRLLPYFGQRVTVRYGTPFSVAEELAAQGEAPKGRKATEAATRLIMARIAGLLPPRQRGVYATDAHVAAVADADAAVAAVPDARDDGG